MIYRKSAFTIVEVMVALVVLAIIAATGTFLVPLYRFALNDSRKIMALNFARQTMEELYWDSGLMAGGGDRDLPANALANAANVSRTFTVTPDDTGNYLIITVNVHWD